MPRGPQWDALIEQSRVWEEQVRKVRRLRVFAALSLATGLLIYITL